VHTVGSLPFMVTLEFQIHHSQCTKATDTSTRRPSLRATHLHMHHSTMEHTHRRLMANIHTHIPVPPPDIPSLQLPAIQLMVPRDTPSLHHTVPVLHGVLHCPCSLR